MAANRSPGDPIPAGAPARRFVADGLAHHRAGRLGEAERLYRQALVLAPNDADALHLLGVVLLQGGQVAEAVERLATAVKRAPAKADFLSHLGMAYKAAGRPADAVKVLRRAVRADAGYAEAHYNLGNALRDLGRREEAEASYRRALDLTPANAEIHNNLGSLLWEQGRVGAALACFEEAVRLKPADPDALNNLGVAFKERGRIDEALACFERALTQKPDFVDALMNLGNAQRAQGRLGEALAAFDRVLAADPDNLVARWSRALSLPTLYESDAEIVSHRERWTAGLAELVRTVRLDSPAAIAAAKQAMLSQTNFNLHYQGFNDRDLQGAYGALLNRIAAAALPQYAEPRAKRPGGGRRRVGFVSAFFSRHTVCHLFAPWVKGLDRTTFEVHAFHAGSADDDETAAVRAAVDRFHRHFGGGEALVRAIAAAELDAVIYLDIGMAPVVQLAAALRLAPLQCATWGHPVTTGLSTIDVFLTSALMEPAGGAAHYTERLHRLANLSIAYPYPPEADAPGAGDGDSAAGEGTLYVCTQSLFKLLPRFDRLIAAIARQAGPCRFAFIEHASAAVTARFRARLGRAFAAAGLDASDFCRFHPFMDRARYYAFNRGADVVLDSTDWSGGKTSLDALACGKPVVTLPGATMRSRHTAAMFERMEIAETVAATEDDYVAIAARLGRDPAWRRAVAATIAARKHRLFDDATPIRELEAFLKGEA